jgi:hypothetical protein
MIGCVDEWVDGVSVLSVAGFVQKRRFRQL